ncbi:3-isopropylmalate dehydratase large subunit [Stutzerimonas nosocomialis]|uniref:3-isopropylmalate dehydratase large subunit n=1 Tax=Stutzerimonas nosocomialis TaxID=1056496 RepID=UPI00110947DC|nr:3-isopropylmalate dehydratase large subunit [Stutzerimonas nosocomialis]TLX56342.1 3-isopropylmalate dehydratase large subunit [Stutzerimonas nosocomialis]
MAEAKTLFQKLWDSHRVIDLDDGEALIYIDRHLVNEVTSPQAFEGLARRGRKPWRVDAVLAAADHNVPTLMRAQGISDELALVQVRALANNCQALGITHYGMDDARQGILHVIAPELGVTQPGMTIACGDSHTSTHGAFGALAFGIGTSDIEHLLASQCLRMRPLKTLRITVSGTLGKGVSSKDLALGIIARLGASGCAGHAIEFAGDTIESLSMEARMTLCNMSIEAGARVGLVGVDQTTIDYLKGRAAAPSGDAWEQAQAYWREFVSDEGARFDRELAISAESIQPFVTWGTSPDMSCTIDGRVPHPEDVEPLRRESYTRALYYMDLCPGMAISDIRLDKVFIGSCTNARIEDLRIAASVVKGQRVAPGIRQALVVPGSGMVKAQAEAEGLDRIFVDAGFEWREPGCSMCLGMNDDRLQPGERCASTSNRNFEGRQGAGGRSHLVSPAMAAAAAIAGHFVDVRNC